MRSLLEITKLGLVAAVWAIWCYGSIKIGGGMIIPADIIWSFFGFVTFMGIVAIWLR